AGVEEADHFFAPGAVACHTAEVFAQGGAFSFSRGQRVDAVPDALEGFGELILLRPGEADMDVAPAGGFGAVLHFDLPDGFHIVDEVHAAEVTGDVVDDHEFAMVAA